MKTCSLCKDSKSLEEFSKCAARADGLQNYCKLCAKEKRAARYQEKKDDERAQNRQWYQENKPWLDQSVRDRINEWRRNADRSVEKNARRALEYNAEGSYTKEEWYGVCEKYGNKCLCCGRPDVKLTQDHVVPLSKGGTNYIDNIQPLCGTCNSSKGAKTIDYRSNDETTNSG